jgi:hypothetical protein
MAEKAGALLRGEVIEEFADTISEDAGGAPGSSVLARQMRLK